MPGKPSYPTQSQLITTLRSFDICEEDVQSSGVQALVNYNLASLRSTKDEP